MLIKFLFFVCCLFWLLHIYIPITNAVENPLSVPNNKIGIHILFPDEIYRASSLVNSNGGQWGYVTIPIQASDRNLEKWQQFMDDCAKLKVIPIIRLATDGDYFNTTVWQKPKEEDVLDFANFLNSLSWPTKNRYVVVFNEVNRANEWGGKVDPEEYASILSYAVTAFKSKSQDFFIISAGLDNGAATIANESMATLDYMNTMDQAIPGIFGQIDGLGSHSYPNPAFMSPPTHNDIHSISSFKFEEYKAKILGGRDLPVFITETGWSNSSLSNETIISYYSQAFKDAWNNEKIVAITPFLLRAASGPFEQFSFFKSDGSPSEVFTYLENLPKTKGQPALAQNYIEGTTIQNPEQQKLLNPGLEKDLSLYQSDLLSKSAVNLVKWLLKL